MKHISIILNSFILTCMIFAAGILLNYGLDFIRFDAINKVMSSHELSTQSYLLEQEMLDLFGGKRCEALDVRISDLKEEIRQVGVDLGSYAKFSFFKKKDFDYLKRKYFLLELNFFTLVEKYNAECGQKIIPILYFYEIDQDESERQGFILEDVAKSFDRQVVVLTLDKEYKDEPLVTLLAQMFNVTKAPTIIFNGIKKEGLTYTGELNATIIKLIRQNKING
ncbi:MAG: hypothetical protein QW666_02080 [Candidatus Woesearchaeota archaeon]